MVKVRFRKPAKTFTKVFRNKKAAAKAKRALRAVGVKSAPRKRRSRGLLAGIL